jgi:hypothetical protein
MKTKKTDRKRLALDTETIKTLQGQELDTVVGGWSESVLPSCNGSCLSAAVICCGKR